MLYHLHVLLKTNRFYVENCNHDRAPLFLPKSGEHDVTLTSFMTDLSEPLKLPLVRVCRIDAGRGMQSLVAISYFVFSYVMKSRWRGGFSPIVSRVKIRKTSPRRTP